MCAELSGTHEEATTRLLLHASHAFHQGFIKLMIQATGTDVYVKSVGMRSIVFVHLKTQVETSRLLKLGH